jgi:rod shape-determining protein MreC
MYEITSRQRPLTLLVIVVIAQILMMAYQIKRNRNVRLVRVWAVEALMPLQRGGTWVVGGVRGGWNHYFALHHASEENDDLRRQVGRLELQNRELESQSAEFARLSELLNFRQANLGAPMLTAEVVGANADSSNKTIFINRGARDHLRNNMAVITPEGVVGKIIETYPDTAQVLLLTDRESGVGALFTETRTQGVIRGLNEPDVRMDYVINEEKVHPGEEVVTSGQDRIFPKDLPVGTVESAQSGNPFQLIRVKPSARIDRLEEVLVLLSGQELKTKADLASASADTTVGLVGPTPSSTPAPANSISNSSAAHPTSTAPSARGIAPPDVAKPIGTAASDAQKPNSASTASSKAPRQHP